MQHNPLSSTVPLEDVDKEIEHLHNAAAYYEDTGRPLEDLN